MTDGARARLFLVAAGVVLTATVLVRAAASRLPIDEPRTTHVIEIRGLTFSPQTITVAVGDTVAWVNRDIFPHTATSGAWDTRTVAAGDTGRLVMTARGEHSYLCAFHPSMTGSVSVR